MAKARLAIVVTHPIQHFVPFYRALAARDDLDVHLIFGAPVGVQAYFDEEMNAEISWNMEMLGGYSHEFLEDARPGQQPSPSWPSSPKVTERLAAFRPDAVLLYGYNQANVRRALWWCGRNRVPAMIISDSELLQERGGIKQAVKALLVRLVYSRISAFLSVGDRNEDYYRHFGAPADRIFRSPFTIDEETYRAARADRAALRAQVRAEFGIPEDEMLALFVGKLSARKRPQDLIDALTRFHAGHGIGALFAGNGELFEELKARAAAENLPARFAGFVNVDRLPALYAAADVLVHPSQADPHPLITSEGACMGLPMIYSDRIGAVGPTDIAREGENVIVYPCGDTAALAEALAILAADPDQRAAMAKRSIEIFDELDMRRSVGGVMAALDAVRR
jgi:glycosyltransferase involved in cell wall biosynthesis